MKIFWILVAGLAVVAVQAQTNQTPAQVAAPPTLHFRPLAGEDLAAKPATAPDPELLDQALQAQLARESARTPLLSNETKPNELVLRTLKLSGILVQLTRTDNWRELFNPAAPSEYGQAEDNLVRDPISSRPAGLKLFAIQF